MLKDRLSWHLERDDQHMVIYLTGHLDMQTAALFRHQVDAFFEHDLAALILDLDALSFLDSSGVGALAQLRKRLNQEQRQLALCGINGQPAAVAKMTGADSVLPIYPTVTEARSALLAAR